MTCFDSYEHPGVDLFESVFRGHVMAASQAEAWVDVARVAAREPVLRLVSDRVARKLEAVLSRKPVSASSAALGAEWLGRERRPQPLPFPPRLGSRRLGLSFLLGPVHRAWRASSAAPSSRVRRDSVVASSADGSLRATLVRPAAADRHGVECRDDGRGPVAVVPGAASFGGRRTRVSPSATRPRVPARL